MQLIKTLTDEIQSEAMEFAVQLERTFLQKITKAQKLIKVQNNENMTTLVITFVDALMTTSVGIAGTYVNKSGDFEDRIVEVVRDKFAMLRKMELEGKTSRVLE